MKYTIENLIGSGGIAEVYRVKDENGHAWAMKRMLAAITDTKIISRFRGEIRIQSTLDHPNIVRVAATSAAGARPFYIMPLAQGSLHDGIDLGAIDAAEMVNIASQILDALVYAHQQGVLHRDIKPKNILKIETRYLIADFGFGKDVNFRGSYKTTTSDNWGTYWYAPPEQRQGLQYCDARSDIYSFGKLLLHCLIGDEVNQIPKTLDTKWQYIIRKCVRDDREHRWQSVAELKRHFDLVFGIDRPLVIDPDGLLGQLAELADAEEEIPVSQIRSLTNELMLIGDDEVLVRQVFRQLPRIVVEAWAKHDADGLREFIEKCDGLFTAGLPFAFCDIVADQYAIIHQISNDIELRQLLRDRLLLLGPAHNRWHVGEVFGKILATLRDPAEIVAAISALEANPQNAQWLKPYIAKATIDRRIRNAIGSGVRE